VRLRIAMDSWSFLVRVKEAEDVDSLVVRRINHDVWKRCEHQFARTVLLADASGEREFPQGFCRGVKALNGGSGEVGVMKIEIIADPLEIARSGGGPPQPPQARIILATRASISSSSIHSPRTI